MLIKFLEINIKDLNLKVKNTNIGLDNEKKFYKLKGFTCDSNGNS